MGWDFAFLLTNTNFTPQRPLTGSIFGGGIESWGLRGHDGRQNFQASAAQRQAELLVLVTSNGQRHRMSRALESKMRGGDGNCPGPLPSNESLPPTGKEPIFPGEQVR